MRFRNHISIIVERMGSFFVLLFFALFTEIGQSQKALEEVEYSALEPKITWLIAGGFLLVLVLLAAWQLLVWSKTYISLQENTIVIERNTMNRKKNVIGIKNISNINMEQNLFERLIGTCKVKLDTNSLSTADNTDVKILLKKSDAQNFRQEVLKQMQQAGDRELEPEEERDMTYDFAADLGEIIVHGLFSINMLSVLVVIGCVAGTAGAIAEAARQGNEGMDVSGMLFRFLAVSVISLSALWDIVKGFVKYYDFKVKRHGDKLYLRYGLLKKVNYTIPADKIQAVRVNQSLFARIAGRYMVEIVNVGMGDDKGEEQSFLVLYCKKEQLKERVKTLLPEFHNVLEEPVKCQPASVWLAWLPGICILGGVLAAGILAGTELLPEYSSQIQWGAAAIAVFFLILLAARYATAGTRLEKEHLVLANGYFKKRVAYIRCSRIQYVQLEQNFAAKLLRIQKGTVYLLASTANKVQGIPYFREQESEGLKEKLLYSR